VFGSFRVISVNSKARSPIVVQRAAFLELPTLLCHLGFRCTTDVLHLPIDEASLPNRYTEPLG
jgi:hypothetical protein